jgi:hypothetical protein
LKEFKIKLKPFNFGSIQFQFELHRPTLCTLGLHVGAPLLPCLSPFLSLTPRPLPPGPTSPRSRLSVTLAPRRQHRPLPLRSPICVATAPPAPDSRGLLPATPICPPPRQGPPSHPSPSSTQARPQGPLSLFLSAPRHRATFQKCQPPPCSHFTPFSSRPCPSNRSRAPAP